MFDRPLKRIMHAIGSKRCSFDCESSGIRYNLNIYTMSLYRNSIIGGHCIDRSITTLYTTKSRRT